MRMMQAVSNEFRSAEGSNDAQQNEGGGNAVDTSDLTEGDVTLPKPKKRPRGSVAMEVAYAPGCL
jgi:hypothetical protein